jgi:pteridine reductase
MQENVQTNKVALITGAARRIGAEIAQALHRAGFNIVLHYHESLEDATELCRHLNHERPMSAVAISASLQESHNAKALIEQAHDIWQRLDVLVNNASRFYRTYIGKTTDYAWQDLLNTNLKAPFFLAQAAVPYLAQQAGATIINVTDIHAELPLTDYAVYCISKSGLLMMTKVLAKELAPAIRVNAVAPGAILWPEGDNALLDTEKQTIIAQTLLQRLGSAQDIAKAVVYLVCDADYMTGQVLNIDGGRTLL